MSDRWTRNVLASRKRLALKEQAVAFLGGKCVSCGYDKCPAAFDFHHVDAAEKDFVISGRTAWNEQLEAELKKCVLLCANCHREVHAGWQPQHLAHDDNSRDDLEWDEEERLSDEAIEAALQAGVPERDAINATSAASRFR